MKIELVNEKSKLAEEPIVIADECGDSKWDAVLAQQDKTSQITKAIQNPDTLVNTIEIEQSVKKD